MIVLVTDGMFNLMLVLATLLQPSISMVLSVMVKNSKEQFQKVGVMIHMKI